MIWLREHLPQLSTTVVHFHGGHSLLFGRIGWLVLTQVVHWQSGRDSVNHKCAAVAFARCVSLQVGSVDYTFLSFVRACFVLRYSYVCESGSESYGFW